jgi:HEAT repeat protein
MKCNQLEGLLPDYLQGTLDQERAQLVESHMENCAQCREEAILWKQLASLPEEQPSPALRSRFTAMLESYQEGRWERSSLISEGRRVPLLSSLGNWFRMPAMAGVAWSCAFMLIGFLIGQSITHPAPPPITPAQFEAMRSDLKSTRQSMVLAMLQLQSASKRLQAVTYSTQDEQPDPQVLGALLHTVRYDASVDVRLAAVDALSKYGARPEVRKGLIESMQDQQSPMVQIALIDLLVDLHDRAAVQQLKRFKQDPAVNPAVKKRAEWGIQKLT